MVRINKRILPLIACVICLLLCNVMAFATEPVDASMTGSVDVTIKAYGTDETVGGGTLNIYKIADVSEIGDSYVYTTEFSGLDDSLLLEDELDKADTANTFAEWIEKADVPAVSVSDISTYGQAYFGDLSLGLYMVMQDEVAQGYEAINPFLVSVPILEDGIWVYNVDATPKTNGAVKTTTEEPKDEPKDEEPKNEEPKDNHNSTGDTGTRITTTNSGGDSGDGSSSSSSSGSSKTGDTMQVAGLSIACAAALAAVAVSLSRRKKSV